MGSDFWDADKILRYDVSARPYRGGPDEAWRGRLGRRRPVGVHAAHGRRRGPEVRGSGRGCRARGLRVAVILRESCHLSIMPGVQQHPRQHICVMMSHMQQCTPVKQCAHRYHQQSCALHHCCSRSIPDSLPQHLRCSTAQRSGSRGTMHYINKWTPIQMTHLCIWLWRRCLGVLHALQSFRGTRKLRGRRRSLHRQLNPDCLP